MSQPPWDSTMQCNEKASIFVHYIFLVHYTISKKVKVTVHYIFCALYYFKESESDCAEWLSVLQFFSPGQRMLLWSSTTNLPHRDNNLQLAAVSLLRKQTPVVLIH